VVQYAIAASAELIVATNIIIAKYLRTTRIVAREGVLERRLVQFPGLHV
jgi:hypothetical protein